MNLLKNKKLKFCISIAFLLFLYTTISAFSYAKTISSDLADSVFRLHVIANSNSDEDQNLKYKVRNSLLEYMNDLCVDCKTKQEAISVVNEHIEEFKQVAIQTIQNEGYNYNVYLETGNFEFPTKQYGDISLPAGFYDALKVEIGEAQGKNWWCVMFPSLCFVDISSGIVPEESKEELKDILTDEEYSLISNDSDANFKLKFKILELFANTSTLTAKN